MPAATATAVPPLEPPGVCSGFHGLRVMPPSTDSVNGHWPNSGIRVLPMITAPAARSRRTTSPSSAHGRGVAAATEGGDAAGDVDLLLDRDRDAVQRTGRLPAASARSRAAASARASSASTTENAFSAGSRSRDPGQAGLDDLDRGDLAVSSYDGPARPRRGRPDVRRCRHGAKASARHGTIRTAWCCVTRRRTVQIPVNSIGELHNVRHRRPPRQQRRRTPRASRARCRCRRPSTSPSSPAWTPGSTSTPSSASSRASRT